jgi:hypothetical protein
MRTTLFSLASVITLSTIFMCSLAYAGIESEDEGKNTTPSRTYQFSALYGGRDTFKSVALEDAAASFKSYKKINKKLLNYYNDYLDKLNRYKIYCKDNQNCQELAEELLKDEDWASYASQPDIDNLDPDRRLKKYYLTLQLGFHPDILLDPVFYEIKKYNLNKKQFYYNYYSQRYTEALEKIQADELENCRAQSNHLALIKADRSGNLGEGVRVIVWDQFAKPKSPEHVLYSERLDHKVPFEVREEAKKESICSVTSGDHGLHVAGLIVDNEFGVAPNAKIIPLNASHLGAIVANREIKFKNDAQKILTNDHGAKIINGSFEFPENDITIKMLGELCKSHLVFIAAGNSGHYVEKVIDQAVENDLNVQNHLFVVANVMPDGQTRNSLSNRFSGVSKRVGIAAPGTDIPSTIPQNGVKQFGFMTGSSMATPQPAGLAARLMSDFPEASITEIANLIRKGLNREGSLRNEEEFGQGMIDVERTYELAHAYFKGKNF